MGYRNDSIAIWLDVGVKVWEADDIELEVWEGDDIERRTLKCLESGDSLNGRNLFLSSVQSPQSLHSLNASPHWVKSRFSSLISAFFRAVPEYCWLSRLFSGMAARRFSQPLFQPYSETPYGCPRILLALPVGFRNGSESRPIGSPNLGCLEKGWNARGAVAILAAVTTLEICLERPFTRMIANERLHLKQLKECNKFSAIATISYCTNYCDRKLLLRRHPLRNPPLLRTPNNRSWVVKSLTS